MILSGTSSTGTFDGTVQAATDQNQLEEDLNRFVNLLVTQLKNQDPLDPLDANEFTAQLVQFASVEQQIHSNANLEKLLNLQQSSQVAAMVDFLGTSVEARGNKVQLQDGRAEFTYAIGLNASDVDISVRNAAGLTVFTAEGNTSAGKHGFVWEGIDDFGNPQPEGAYTIIVTARDAQKNLMDVEQTVFGRVTGAGADGGEVTIFTGDVAVPMTDILSVKETVVADDE